MCRATIHINNLLTEYQSIKSEYENLISSQSKIDLAIQDVLHLIENNDFNAYQGFVLAKKLQELRKERRLIKNELEPMSKLIGTISLENQIGCLNNTEKRVQKIEYGLNKQTTNKYYKPRVLKAEDFKYSLGKIKI